MSESNIGVMSLIRVEPSIRIVVSGVIFETRESMCFGVIVMLVCCLLFSVSSFDNWLMNWLPLFWQFGNRANMYCRLRCSNVFFSTVVNSESCCGLNCISFG